jgi:hypothetical protein
LLVDNALVQIDPDWTVVRAKDVGLDIGIGDPWQETGRDEDVVDSGAIVGRSGVEFRVPAWDRRGRSELGKSSFA